MMTRFQPFAPFPFERKMDINGASPTSRAAGGQRARRWTPATDLGLRARAHTRTCVYERSARLSSSARQSGSRIDSSGWTCPADYTTSRLIIPASKSIRIA